MEFLLEFLWEKLGKNIHNILIFRSICNRYPILIAIIDSVLMIIRIF